ncbi:MAG: hypothetical protein V7752_09960 [Halopseudomonas sp.]
MVVFKILSKVSGQHYVGSCRSDIYERWELYLRAAEAGLDFPLYHEIREHGEAQFLIAELDYAEDIAELKEMELLHTVELLARSLRNYKFGRSDTVVKRTLQSDQQRAWMKDLPAEDQLKPRKLLKTAAKPAAKSAAKSASKSKPALARTRLAEPAKLKQIVTPSSRPSVSDVATKPAVARAAVVESLAAKPTAEDAAAELDKSLFAEGIGLLVRAVASVEQLNNLQQQASGQVKSLTDALAESDRALQQLQSQQHDAAEKARQAMAAVEASQLANTALLEAQRQAHVCADSALTALNQGKQSSLQAAQLQQDMSRLLGRLKSAPSASKPDAVATAKPETPAPSATDLNRPFVSVSVPQPVRPTVSPVSPVAQEQELMKAEEAKMVNQLKQLDKLLVEDDQAAPQVIDSTEHTSISDTAEDPLGIGMPARAWVAGAVDGGEPAQVLAKQVSAATVIRRRSKAPSSVVAVPSQVASSAASERAVVSRKTLSIKAR